MTAFRDTLADTPGLVIVVPVTSDVDRFRYPDIHTLDLRVAKDFHFSALGFTLSADVFNALNESYVLQRQGVLGDSKGDHVQEILSPRVLRLGGRGCLVRLRDACIPALLLKACSGVNRGGCAERCHPIREMSHEIRGLRRSIRERSHKFRQICHRARELSDRARCAATHFADCVTQLAV